MAKEAPLMPFSMLLSADGRKRTLGIANGKYKIPDDIDENNDEIAVPVKEVDIMSTQQIINDLISHAPENKLDIILSFIKFVLHEDDKINNSLLSEPSLSKDWSAQRGMTHGKTYKRRCRCTAFSVYRFEFFQKTPCP